MKRFFSFLSILLVGMVLFLFMQQTNQTAKAADKINSVTTITSSSTTSVYGQPIIFTATVAPASSSVDVPTGDVTFNIIGYGETTGQLDVTGKATATLSTLQPGTYVVFATYNGDTNFNASISPVVIQTVTLASTTTAISASTNPSVYGESVTFTATVTPVSPAEGTPTGNVIFAISGYGSITEPLDSTGKATATINTLNASSYSIIATYSGDIGFGPSTSSVINLVVNKASTTTSLSSNPNPSDPGQTVTFTASIAPVSPGAGVPTGTVTFTVDGTVSASSTLANGEATYSTNALASGEHTILAQYNGDSNFDTSSSSSFTQNVRTVTSFSLTSDKNPSNQNDAVTFTTSGLPDDATGDVTFFNDGVTLGTSTVSGGKADFMVSSFSAGTHTITAQYSGDDHYLPSTSPDFIQTVSEAYSYTVRYIDLLTGKPIAPEVQGSGQLGETITITAPQIDGYLLQGASSKSFTLNTGSNVETFSYISITSTVLIIIIADIMALLIIFLILRAFLSLTI